MTMVRIERSVGDGVFVVHRFDDQSLDMQVPDEGSQFRLQCSHQIKLFLPVQTEAFFCLYCSREDMGLNPIVDFFVQTLKPLRVYSHSGSLIEYHWVTLELCTGLTLVSSSHLSELWKFVSQFRPSDTDAFRGENECITCSRILFALCSIHNTYAYATW